MGPFLYRFKATFKRLLNDCGQVGVWECVAVDNPSAAELRLSDQQMRSEDAAKWETNNQRTFMYITVWT